MVKKDKPDKEKKPEDSPEVYRKGNQYYCAECNSVLEMHGDCPYCRAHINWDKIKVEIDQW
jgi:hypothetical protein